ncbi:eif3a [Symbiodinium sp. CCMP2592]|nr:eif3a [Symbiodinium sp. CCMP2592]
METPSRTRAKAESRGITLEDLRGLLDTQTQQIQESHQQDLLDLKTATFKELTTIKKDVRKQGDHIEQLRDQYDQMESRIRALEEKGPSTSTVASESGRPNLLIMAGWPQDTPKDTLLQELDDCLKQLGLAEAFEEMFCTGPRRGFAMTFVRTDHTESGTQLKRRLITIAQQVQRANLRAPSMDQDKTLRATLGKSREERLLSNHTGKTKRLILAADPSLKLYVETKYSAGSVWCCSQLMSSATRPPPRQGCKAGKPPRSWIDLQSISVMLRVSADDLEKQWDDLMSY